MTTMPSPVVLRISRERPLVNDDSLFAWLRCGSPRRGGSSIAPGRCAIKPTLPSSPPPSCSLLFYSANKNNCVTSTTFLINGCRRLRYTPRGSCQDVVFLRGGWRCLAPIAPSFAVGGQKSRRVTSQDIFSNQFRVNKPSLPKKNHTVYYPGCL